MTLEQGGMGSEEVSGRGRYGSGVKGGWGAKKTQRKMEIVEIKMWIDGAA